MARGANTSFGKQQGGLFSEWPKGFVYESESITREGLCTTNESRVLIKEARYRNSQPGAAS